MHNISSPNLSLKWMRHVRLIDSPIQSENRQSNIFSANNSIRQLLTKKTSVNDFKLLSKQSMSCFIVESFFFFFDDKTKQSQARVMFEQTLKAKQ